MIIVDEVSIASKKQIELIQSHCKILNDNHMRPGGEIDVICCGNMRQLKPGQNDTPIHTESFLESHGTVNAHIELRGMHRFTNVIYKM